MNYSIFLWILAVVLGVTTGLLNWSFWVPLGIIGVLAVFNFVYTLYIIYKSQNLGTIEKFLRKNKRNPIYGFTLELKYGTKEDVINKIELITKRYKQPLIKHTYGFNHALFLKEYEIAKNHAKQIESHPLGQYCLALVAAFEGDDENALNKSLKYEWMREAVTAVYYFAKHDLAAYRLYRDKAISASYGIQHFSNVYFFKQLEQN